MVRHSLIGPSVRHYETPILHLRAGDKGRSVKEEIGGLFQSVSIPFVLITAWLPKLVL